MAEILIWLSLYLYVMGMLAFGMAISEAHNISVPRTFVGLMFWPVIVPFFVVWGFFK